MQNILLIFLGSFLTFLATVIVEWFKNKQENNSKRQNFKLITKQELQAVSKTLEKLKTVFEYKNYFDYSIVDSIDKSVKELESIRHDSIYLNNESLQEKYINICSEIAKFASSVRAIQNLYYNQQTALATDKTNAKKIKNGTAQKISIFTSEKENQETFQQKCTQEFIDLVEINRKLDDLINLLGK